jgi:DNA invertase Pin-like site-specific DNA recombinase
MPTAAIYTRLSQDREGGKTGTERQEADCRAWCEREGLDVAKVFTDPDTSAYNGRHRPQFEAMLDELGSFDALVYWKTDRLTRNAIEYWKVLDACERANVRLVSVVDPVDTSHPMGKGVAGMFASMGEQESYNTSLRVKRADAAGAQAGRPHGGRRCFGYTTAMEQIPNEAKVGREVFERVIGGESLRKVAEDLNRRSITNAARGQWTQSALSVWLKSARVAGIRIHNGTKHRGTWEGIITPDEQAALLRELERRGTAGGRVARPKQLVSGFIFCARCEGRMVVKGGRYQCDKHPGNANCGGVAANAEMVDGVVVETFLETLPRTRLRPLPEAEEAADLRAEIAEHEHALDDIFRERYRVGGGISDATYREVVQERQQRLQTAIAALAALERQAAALRDAVHPENEEELRAWWERASLDDRRVALRNAIMSVKICPAKARGGNRFEPERVVVFFNWKLYLDIAEKFEETATPEDWANALAEYNAMNEREMEAALESAAPEDLAEVVEQYNVY